ncbi:hypothetical protein VNO77_19880 [Canavalia gladiata]|uniref:Uncharacterized protein n=1 Tax=Canavalia gladiata TaxID=3824 RepID=A0AAN9LNB7_CANGL
MGLQLGFSISTDDAAYAVFLQFEELLASIAKVSPSSPKPSSPLPSSDIPYTFLLDSQLLPTATKASHHSLPPSPTLSFMPLCVPYLYFLRRKLCINIDTPMPPYSFEVITMFDQILPCLMVEDLSVINGPHLLTFKFS